MADYDSSLPVRSEADGTDERLHAKIVDGTTPSQRAEVDTDNNLHVEVHGNNSAGSDEVLRLGELGQVNPDGDYDATNNTKPASIGNIAHDRAATPADTDQNLRVTGVTGSTDTTHHSMDVSIHDGSGDAYSDSNPIPTYITDDPGEEKMEYNTSAAVAKDASVDHDYSVANGDVFKINGFYANASGKIKVEFKIGDGAVSEIFTSKAVFFNSTANPNCEFKCEKSPFSVTGTANDTTIRITITNLDNQAQDVYSTLLGIEV